MKKLLRTQLSAHPPACDVGGDCGVVTSTCKVDTENVHIATYLTNGLLQLQTIHAKQPTTAQVKLVDWRGTGYSDLSSLSFDIVGAQLLAVTSRYVNIIPYSTFMRQTGGRIQASQADRVLDAIRLTSVSGAVTCSVWWQTALNKNIVIIGTEKGDLLFVDIPERKCVHKLRLQGHLCKLEVVPDDRQHTTYLLISGRSSLQWRLLLDVHDRDLYMSKSGAEMSDLGYMFYGGKTYIKSILQTRTYSASVRDEFSPQRFTNVPISVSLRYQSAKGCHLLSAMDKRDNSLKIYDSNAEHLPLYEYTLPYSTEHVIYTDRLIFCASTNQHVLVLANHLSEKDSQLSQGGHVLYRHDLGSNEKILLISALRFPSTWYTEMKTVSSQFELVSKSHTILDGCLVITNKHIIQIIPNLSPEQLFLNWSIEPIIDIQALESLAQVTHIDILSLYLHSAEYHLNNLRVYEAMQCLNYSKCDVMTRISLLHKHRQYSTVLDLSTELLYSSNNTDNKLTNATKTTLSNMLLDSYVYGCEDKAELSSHAQFREFLLYNTQYSLDTAMRMLCDFDLISLLIPVAIHRKFLHGALEHILIQDKITEDTLHEFIDNKDMLSVLPAVSDGALVYMLSSRDLSTYLLLCDSIKLEDLKWCIAQVSNISTESLRLLVQRYHPHSSFVSRSLAKYQQHLESRSAQSYASLVQDSTESETHGLSLNDFTSQLSIIYIKLLYELISRVEHTCLLRCHLDRLATELDTVQHAHSKTRRHSIIGSIRLTPLCCNSTTVYSIQKDALYTWGSKVKMDDLSMDDRVIRSTPACMTLAPVCQSEVKAVSCGERHLMILCTDGLYGAGSSEYGQLGTGACTSDHTQIAKLSHIAHVVSVVCGRYHTLAIDKHGRLYSWGWGLFGQLGHGDIQNRDTPALVDTLSDEFIVSISAGHSHSLALTKQGKLYAFGSNVFGQVDMNQSSLKLKTPTLLSMNSPVKLISTKYFHNIAVLESGDILLWGIHPVAMKRKANSSRVSAVQGGASRPRSLSQNDNRQFDSRARRSVILTEARKSDKITQVCSGVSHSLFLTASGSVYSWEENVGRRSSVESHLSDSSSGEQATRLSSLENVTFIACDFGYSLALCGDGSLRSWGKNDYAQLGLSLRNIRYMQKSANVKIPKHCYVSTSQDMLHSLETMDCHSCGLDAATEGGEGDTPDITSQHAADHRQDCDLVLELGTLSRSEDAFPIYEALSLSLTSRVYNAAVALACGTRSWSEACFYHLKSLLSCDSHLDQTYSSQILDVIDFYITRVTSDDVLADVQRSHDLAQLILRVLQFWQAKQLDIQPTLEERLSVHMSSLSPYLSNLLLTKTHNHLNDKFIQGFSSSFLARVSRSCMTHMTQINQTEDKSTVWSNVIQQVSKGLSSRPSTTLTQFDLHRLLSEPAEGAGEDNSDIASDSDVIVFTCGHHYSTRSFHNKMLVGFESRISNTLPITGALILEQYKSGDCVSLACPQCVQHSLRQVITV